MTSVLLNDRIFDYGDVMNSGEFYKIFKKELFDFDLNTLMEILFMEYKKKCNERSVYDIRDFLPHNLIKLYYSRGVSRSDFKQIVSTFKDRYIDQESKLEGVHDPLEIEGLGVVYDYIRSDDWKNCPNIYIIYLINMKLFSKVPYSSFGGKNRNADCYLKGASIETCPYVDIDREIASLYGEFDALFKRGINLGLNNSLDNEEDLINYINDCLRLKTKLIKIHPFSDGNGRTMRALVNLMFKLANLPPVYVKSSEKDEYLDIMNIAICDGNFDYLNKFYYYKICDSIVELDLNNKVLSCCKVKKLVKN